MKLAFILNPHSGGNRRRPWLAAAVAAAIAEQALPATLHLTEGPGHATTLAETALAAGCTRVVAIGGDGTLNEVARVLTGSPAWLGVIPGGSGNGLALQLGLPMSFRPAWALVTRPDAPARVVDTGRVNGHMFCNCMGLGFDAEVGARFNRLEKRGLPAYARVTLQSLRDLQPVRCRITSASGNMVSSALLVAIANSSQYGNNAYIAPPALVDDGQLDLIVVHAGHWFGTATLLPSLFLRNLHRRSRVTHQQGTHFVIERDQPGLIHTDGETFEAAARLEIEVRPRSLHLIVPSTSTSRRA